MFGIHQVLQDGLLSGVKFVLATSSSSSFLLFLLLKRLIFDNLQPYFSIFYLCKTSLTVLYMVCS